MVGTVYKYILKRTNLDVIMYSNELLDHLRLRDFFIPLVVISYVIRSVLLFLYVSYIVTSERCLTKHAHITY